MKFRFLPDIVTADLAFEAYGRDLNQLFENAASALESVMVDLSTLGTSIEKSINLETENLEGLLFKFLEELVFLKDSEQLLFSQLKCDVRGVKNGRWIVNSDLRGEKIDTIMHRLGVDVKAITKHLFEVKQTSDKSFRCRVVLDV